MDEDADFEFCCDAMQAATADLPEPASPTIFVSEDEVLMMVVGLVETEDGLGFMEQAVAYCPSCGTHIQDVEALAKEARQ